MKKRVVITGLGALSPIGNTVTDLWKSIREGKCGIEKITHFDTTDFKAKLAGEVKDLDMEQYFSKRDLKFNDRFTQFARIAAKQAMMDSQLDTSTIDTQRFGVIIASGIGGIESIENAEDTLKERGPSRVSPFFIPMALVNLAAGNVAIDVGAKGHCSSQVTACAAASNAIGEAFHKIRDGYEDVMLAGGSEASITPLAIAGFASMRALHTGEDPNRASIPFDKERSGFVMGEGAGVLVLEELEHAQKRKAKIYGEIIGYGSTCDAFHITAPIDDGSGGRDAMLRAIKDADIKAEDIAYINAHGTSTPLNDKTETMAIKGAFKDHAYNLAVSSTKSNTGHLLGASGAIEALITVKAVQEGFIPATINYQNADDDCDLDIVPNHGREQEMQYAMSNSLGFGGHNVSLIFKKWED
ncbi:3-oxoacyl-[acyl-carrier-protein] synthase II [Breznakia sp. PF5-3]|uniref:beta-ketoacyl-ACP synthase II n=1 Tax=unclassified Breznakia TaxID=2623764 RepID=UPI002405B5DD|nr:MULTISPECIES: beta-ketoacyl-ACP synthase II [unclassified Breznakia]MDL2276193.1 beta-ketoacyl-ACP synthase II [Breznakia sp. OttesenSCG-928-G09]MDF9824714.1 3-oxoacyl-[acyl-carrier-protein] synthase II [Breznakia sp. PM6-1]MDF9835377.1 3-oxoacyl-[acyl-carrier-protein] synthase II [Breznakia sp. PF5-3]MDF9836976.1 3-oxoacyl-[acyl-carrier-protein] synthase II [Breznakia sp. PFB2-8]MDF9859612.1 3-oxoacyl-[acyl-carrier-protein] synthase II [Breznakia sp. PH5-24]